MSSWLKLLFQLSNPPTLQVSTSRNELKTHTQHESQISHFGGEKTPVGWLQTKRFLARAKQKGQKTEQNNFSWMSGRLNWSTARCSLLSRSNRKNYQKQTLNNSRLWFSLRMLRCFGVWDVKRAYSCRTKEYVASVIASLCHSFLNLKACRFLYWYKL